MLPDLRLAYGKTMIDPMVRWGGKNGRADDIGKIPSLSTLIDPPQKVRVRDRITFRVPVPDQDRLRLRVVPDR